jgi:NAD(P)-dependent dehydrogenase (short-subunit alcohol dehydrogenase family)
VVASDIAAADLRETRFVQADVAQEGAVEQVVEETLGAFGRLDLAANCAGIGGGHAATHEYPVEAWDRIVAVNLRGTWLSMRAEIPAMLADGTGGAIVNVASTLGLRGSPFGSPYSASKHGVLGLTKTAAIEYAQQGIRVNAVCPGAIDTPMMDDTFERFPGFREMLIGFVPLGRMGTAAEVAAAIAWLGSDAASFITGEGLTIEGGLLAR